jgi:3',5'-cyclic-AMP phosphodiesterase
MKNKLAWVTDIHLNFLSIGETFEFYDKINKESPDILLVGGDIAEAPSIIASLEELSVIVEAPIYFVLGNHDYYRGSFTKVKKKVEELVLKTEGLHWLDLEQTVQLTEEVGLIGHGSWADGRYGDYSRSFVQLSDYVYIEDFSSLSKNQILKKLNKLGDEAATQVKKTLTDAFERYKQVFFLTHVPPFKEASWHEGKISNDDFLPHFSCKAVGDVLKKVMRSRPDCYLTVLCGHTHGSGKVQMMDNLEVRTGGAVYGQPELQELIYI